MVSSGGPHVCEASVMTAQTYIPAVHCVVCINLGHQVSATARVKGYRVCDSHAELVERTHTIDEALRETRHHNAIRGTSL